MKLNALQINRNLSENLYVRYMYVVNIFEKERFIFDFIFEERR